jgi:hypothetical protein
MRSESGIWSAPAERSGDGAVSDKLQFVAASAHYNSKGNNDNDKLKFVGQLETHRYA